MFAGSGLVVEIQPLNCYTYFFRCYASNVNQETIDIPSCSLARQAPAALSAESMPLAWMRRLKKGARHAFLMSLPIVGTFLLVLFIFKCGPARTQEAVFFLLPYPFGFGKYTSIGDFCNPNPGTREATLLQNPGITNPLWGFQKSNSRTLQNHFFLEPLY